MSSWTARTDNGVAADALTPDAFAATPEGQSPAEKAQLVAGIEAASGIIESGTVGDANGEYYVSLSGDAGDDAHKPTLSLTVTQV